MMVRFDGKIGFSRMARIVCVVLRWSIEDAAQAVRK